MLYRIGRLVVTGALVQQSETERERYKAYERDDRATWNRLIDFVNFKITKYKDSFKKVGSDKVTPTYAEVRQDIESKITGWWRLKYLFRMSENGAINPEMRFILDSATFGFFLGFFYGGLRDYKKAFNLFVESNEATKFLSVKEARVKLGKASMKAFLKGGVITGPKTGILLPVFLFTSMAVSTYRGKNGIVEFPIAGALTTVVMKWNLGIRGMISGFVSGGLTGLIMGPIFYCTLKIFGMEMSDLLYYTPSSMFSKSESLKSDLYSSEVIDALERIHEARIKHLRPEF